MEQHIFRICIVLPQDGESYRLCTIYLYLDLTEKTAKSDGANQIEMV